jgi:phosphatidylserine decarboxylase
MTIRRQGAGAKVAVIAVGAMLVGSIFYVPGVDEQGAQVRRGQCLGGFKYGGSVCQYLVALALFTLLTYTDRHCRLSARRTHN